jgi:hypothetical protein
MANPPGTPPNGTLVRLEPNGGLQVLDAHSIAELQTHLNNRIGKTFRDTPGGRIGQPFASCPQMARFAQGERSQTAR